MRFLYGAIVGFIVGIGLAVIVVPDFFEYVKDAFFDDELLEDEEEDCGQGCEACVCPDNESREEATEVEVSSEEAEEE